MHQPGQILSEIGCNLFGQVVRTIRVNQFVISMPSYTVASDHPGRCGARTDRHRQSVFGEALWPSTHLHISSSYSLHVIPETHSRQHNRKSGATTIVHASTQWSVQNIRFSNQAKSIDFFTVISSRQITNQHQFFISWIIPRTELKRQFFRSRTNTFCS